MNKTKEVGWGEVCQGFYCLPSPPELLNEFGSALAHSPVETVPHPSLQFVGLICFVGLLFACVSCVSWSFGFC